MIDFLVIGHVVQDVVPDGYTVGGTTTYSSITARNLGREPGIVTRLAPDFVLPEVLHDIAVHRIPSAHTTTFHNIYRDGHREQFLLARAEPLEPDDVPPAWRNAPIVHLGPLARELDPRIAEYFPRALVGVTPQGWMRQWDDPSTSSGGRVRMRPWEEAADILPYVDVLVLSEEDLNGNLALMDEYVRLTRIAVMTQGAQGCMVFANGEARQVPGFPAREVDPTGAGDVFAAAFLVRLSETHDPFQAARFANATASFCVEAHGVTGIPTREQVQARLDGYSGFWG
ncbi:MAG: ribokinase [Chloroflexi bacterium]|nr:ribokinase [Chloroflexota bacterium]